MKGRLTDTGRCGLGATVQKSNREQGKQRSRLVEHLQDERCVLSCTSIVVTADTKNFSPRTVFL